MKRNVLILIALIAVVIGVGSSIARAGSVNHQSETLADTVRQVTAQFKDVKAAEAAGYGLFHGCTSGPQEGAMGIHYANGSLAGDGEVDEQRPDVLLYAPKNDKLELVGVEYLVFADDWNKNHDAPPVLKGQLFNYLGTPNRYGLPALYELHVWAWKNNPAGVFADFNPQVSCEDFVGLGATPNVHH